MTALASLLDLLPPLTLVAGKGGVGKTTLATGLAAHFAAASHHTLLLSTDPALTLADAVGIELAPSPRPVPGHPRLDAMQLSAHAARAAFLARWRETIISIIDRGTYLDLDDITGLVDAALPGADEIFALLELAELAAASTYDRIVVDTAPTGHTLRLLALPDTFTALVQLLDAMQGKHRFMVKALTHRYRTDAADEFIERMRKTIDGLRDVLTDPQRGGALLVCRAEGVVAAESVRYAAALAEARVSVKAVVVNATPISRSDDERRALTALRDVARDAPHFMLPRAAEPPIGIDAIAELVSTMAKLEAPPAGGKRKAPRAKRRAEVGVGQNILNPLLAPSLLIVGGKGGVGKTTVSCALAIAAADRNRRVLLVSTDPAPSIADALAQPVSDEERAIEGVPALRARQMDAAAAFNRFRDEYQNRIDAIFDALTSSGLQATYDHAILRDLLALAPPGIDELYALASLGETLTGNRFDMIVVDPAPTGHLLRLLEMPPIVLDWTHRLMRLMLKYKDVAALGDTAQELLAFAKRTRALDAAIHDAQTCGVAVVTLDEPLVRGETLRLIDAVRSRRVSVMGVVCNRSRSPEALPLPASEPLRHFVAPATEPAPIGVEGLRAWSAQWTELTTRDG